MDEADVRLFVQKHASDVLLILLLSDRLQLANDPIKAATSLKASLIEHVQRLPEELSRLPDPQGAAKLFEKTVHSLLDRAAAEAVHRKATSPRNPAASH